MGTVELTVFFFHVPPSSTSTASHLLLSFKILDTVEVGTGRSFIPVITLARLSIFLPTTYVHVHLEIVSRTA